MRNSSSLSPGYRLFETATRRLVEKAIEPEPHYYQAPNPHAQRVKERMKQLLTQIDQDLTTNSQAQEYGLHRTSALENVQNQHVLATAHSGFDSLRVHNQENKQSRLEERRANTLVMQEKLRREIGLRLQRKQQKHATNILQQQKEFITDFKRFPVLGDLKLANQQFFDRQETRILEIQRDRYQKIWKRHKLQPSREQTDHSALDPAQLPAQQEPLLRRKLKSPTPSNDPTQQTSETPGPARNTLSSRASSSQYIAFSKRLM